jgi:putative protease
MDIELLSPAKDLECGKAAIRFGADAVYIGGPDFGARKSASNSLEDIAELVKFAHFFNAKVYVTINTIIYDRELFSVEQLISDLYKIKVDAIIIQDIGILDMDLPNIDIIISTQTTNITKEKIKFFEDLGVKRVILERALSLQEIKEIRANTTTELEVFVHGAICVCYSGECNMSYKMGGRSANRGECAQPCRKVYSLTDKDGSILKQSTKLLSVKDLNLSQSLDELIDAGISSFKIEGRLKDLNYVSNVTAFYRQRLDEVLTVKLLNKTSVGVIYNDFEPNLSKTFNRGYTEYFINRKNKVNSDLIFDQGEYIGEVNRVEGNNVWLDTKIELHNGDGLVYLAEDDKQGFFVNKFEDGCVTANKEVELAKGTKIFRNYDAKFIDKLIKSKTTRKIEVIFALKELNGSYKLEVQDINRNSLVTTNILKDKIENVAQDYEERIIDTLRKLGNTLFVCEQVILDLKKQYFIPLSDLKRSRNELLAGLTKLREEREPTRTVRKAISVNNAPNLLVANLNSERLLSKDKNVVELGYSEDAPLMRTRYCILRELEMCLKTSDISQPLYLKDEKNTFELKFDCSKCEMTIC